MDAQAVFDEAALVHFSDWPLPKPWTQWSSDALAEMRHEVTVADDVAEGARRALDRMLAVGQ